jgi:hypothetical protein
MEIPPFILGFLYAYLKRERDIQVAERTRDFHEQHRRTWAARRHEREAGSSWASDCLTCGAALGMDPDDDPYGDAGGPICGECDRARNFDVILEELAAEED